MQIFAIVINFEVTPIGFWLVSKNKNEVYTPGGEWFKKYFTKKNLRDGWERIDHSVLVYGYGVDNKVKKYWRIQNSWGTMFGNNGRVKII